MEMYCWAMNINFEHIIFKNKVINVCVYLTVDTCIPRFTLAQVAADVVGTVVRVGGDTALTSVGIVCTRVT